MVPKLHYKLLTDGHSVTLEDGTVVSPEQVVDPPAPAQCFAFIFLNDEHHLRNFIANFDKTVLKYYSLDQIDPTTFRLAAIYHSMPSHLMKDEKYLDLIQTKFGSDVMHILDSPDSNLPVLSKSKANFYTEKIKMVCPRLFPTSYGNSEDLPHFVEEQYGHAMENFKSIQD